MTHILDELTRQRCVDGELNEAEQQALLRQLERNPAGWREVALGFMEHQLWSTAGHDWVHEPAPPQAATDFLDPPPRPDRSWVRNTMLAASTLVAVGLGYLGGSQRFWPGESSSASPRTITQQSAPVEQTQLASVTIPTGSRPAPHPARRAPTPVMQVQVASDGQGSPPITLPVYDAEELEKYGPWTPPQLSAEVLQRLKDQGVQVQQEPRFYPVPNTQNRNWVVPVNTIQLRQSVQ